MNRKKLFFNKKSKLVFIEAVVITCGCMLAGVPLVGNGFGNGSSYYEVTLEGRLVGSVKNPDVVEQAFLDARARISRETEGLVLADVEYSMEKIPKVFATTMDTEMLTDAIYQELRKEVETAKHKAYQLKVNEFTVTLGSYQDVMDVLYATKDRFDTNNEFQISIVSNADRELNVYTVQMSKQEAEEEAADSGKSRIRVGNAAAGIAEFDVTQSVEEVITKTVTGADLQQEETPEEDSKEVQGDGLRNLYFSEQVEIVEAYVSEDEITPTAEAIDMVTKDTEKNEVYEVQPGDSLSVIANSHDLLVREVLALNEGLEETTTLQIGDEIVITVPQPELSVMSVEESTYEEDYFAETQYIDNDSWYTTETEVRQEAQQGHRQVTALITRRNDAEEGREIIAETIMAEAIPQIIERGTMTPPTYIKPLSGGRLSSGFGARWGSVYKGIDWACPIGTAIMASSGGTVVQAGWFSSYGNCVTIRHPDGKQTRYAHLSRVLVSAGQSVQQGQKIALSGNTGWSTGPHVHFEIIVNGRQVNPMGYL